LLVPAPRLLDDGELGATPFLIDSLIVDRGLAVIQGRPKVGKTWLLLEIAISLATGQPVLGRFETLRRGPVILVVEESGEQALGRRLQQLCCGRRMAFDDLQDLHVAANRRVRLDDRTWQDRLNEQVRALRPVAILLDPLARLKSDDRDEDSQHQMAPVVSFLRELRESSDGIVAFVHHVGHREGRLRGTSDLEAVWDTKLSLRRSGNIVELASEHRDAADANKLRYRVAVSELEQALRLVTTDDPVESQWAVLDYLHVHSESPRDEIVKGLGRRREDTLRAINELLESGRLVRAASDSSTSRRSRGGEILAIAPSATLMLFRERGNEPEPGDLMRFPAAGNQSEQRNDRPRQPFRDPAPLKGRGAERRAVRAGEVGADRSRRNSVSGPSTQRPLFDDPSKDSR
jgi:hypothetical protein